METNRKRGPDDTVSVQGVPEMKDRIEEGLAVVGMVVVLLGVMAAATAALS